VIGSGAPSAPPRRASRRAVLPRQAEVEFVLASSQTLPRDRLEQLKLGVVVRRPDVLDVP
jgi:hypothetical protein